MNTGADALITLLSVRSMYCSDQLFVVIDAPRRRASSTTCVFEPAEPSLRARP